MMRLLSGGVSVLLALSLLFGCGRSEEKAGPTFSELAAVHAVADSFVRAVRDQDAERFASLFTDSATYASNDGQLWRSREEILAGARRWMQVPQEPTRRTVRADVSGDVAYLFEEYSSEVRLSVARSVTVTGRSLAVLRRQPDGSWKIDALVVNREPGSDS